MQNNGTRLWPLCAGLGVSHCCGLAVDQSSLLSLYWSVRKGHHKDLIQRTQYSTTQCCSPGLLIIQAQLEQAYSIEERPWAQKDKPHNEATTNQNN